MKQKENKPNLSENKTKVNKEIAENGKSFYPAEEDIYSKLKNEVDIDSENIKKIKSTNENDITPNEKDFEHMMTGSDLDIPGSELDNDQEDIGSEDEENNHYSLGGDAHNNLEEDNG